jgi:hypothetical protein
VGERMEVLSLAHPTPYALQFQVKILKVPDKKSSWSFSKIVEDLGFMPEFLYFVGSVQRRSSSPK